MNQGVRRVVIAAVSIGAMLFGAAAPGAAGAKVLKRFKADVSFHADENEVASGGGDNGRIQTSSGSAQTILDASFRTKAVYRKVAGFGKTIDLGTKQKAEGDPRGFGVAVPVAGSPGSGVAAIHSSGSWLGLTTDDLPYACAYDVGGPGYGSVMSFVSTTGGDLLPGDPGFKAGSTGFHVSLGDRFGQRTYPDSTIIDCGSNIESAWTKPIGILMGDEEFIFDTKTLLKARKQPGNPGQTVNVHQDADCTQTPIQDGVCKGGPVDITATARLLKK